MSSFPVCFSTQDAPVRSGIALSHLDTKTGALTSPQLIAQTPDPSFIAVQRDVRNLYICNSQTPGGLSAFAIHDAAALSFLNFRQSAGRGPSHVALDRTGRFVLNANYGGGYIEVYATLTDGRLGERTAFVQHTGSSAHPQRQASAHAHWFGTTPDNRFALATDLGTDRIHVYRFDERGGTLEPHEPAFISTTPGSGPRHIAWHPDGAHFYLIEELANAITLYAWHADSGTTAPLQTMGTLPDDFRGENTAAEIVVHPDGRFLYASNRGHDSIALVALDGDGRMKLRSHTASRGKTPRYFALSPDGRWLLATNQASDCVVVFAVNGVDGTLTPTGEPIGLPRPGAVVFLTAGNKLHG
jgi:6-phosphogluconolactonase